MLHVIDKISGRALEVESRGQGEPLLLIQGMSGHRGIWGDAFLGPLAQDREVIMVEHRGVAGSTAVDGPFTIADLAADALALLDVLGRDSVRVMGISMGGMVAQELALLAPDRVRSLVLGCTTAGGPGAFAAATGPGRLLTAMAARDVELATRVAFEVNVSATFAEREGELERFRAASLSHRVPVPVIQLQGAACMGHDTVSRVGSLTCPTVVVHGEVDEMIPVAEGVKLAEAVPGARLELWPDTGHLFWWERPAEAAALVLEHTTT